MSSQDVVAGSSRPTTPPTRPALRAAELPSNAAAAGAPINASNPSINGQQQQPSISNSIPPSITNVPAASRSKIVPTVVQDGIRIVPPLFELCQVDDLINLIAHMLDRLIQHNDRIPLTPNALTRFHSRAPPAISVRDYLLRIAKYTNVEPCCLLMLLPYVDKVCSRLSTFTISSLTVHRFVIACISVGSKALSDAFCTNGRYARVGGVSIAEMNLLEKELCEAIDWRLTTSGQTLAHYYTSLVRSHPGYQLATVVPTTPIPIKQITPPIPERGPALIPPRVLSERRNSTASNLPSPVGNKTNGSSGGGDGGSGKGAVPMGSSSSSSLSSIVSSSVGSSSLASASASASASGSTHASPSQHYNHERTNHHHRVGSATSPSSTTLSRGAGGGRSLSRSLSSVNRQSPLRSSGPYQDHGHDRVQYDYNDSSDRDVVMVEDVPNSPNTLNVHHSSSNSNNSNNNYNTSASVGGHPSRSSSSLSNKTGGGGSFPIRRGGGGAEDGERRKSPLIPKGNDDDDADTRMDDEEEVS